VLLLPLVLCGGPWCGLWRPLMHGLWRPLMWALAAPGMGLGGPYFVGFGAFVVSDRYGPWFGLRLPLVRQCCGLRGRSGTVHPIRSK
jgi:hypothetical protein